MAGIALAAVVAVGVLVAVSQSRRSVAAATAGNVVLVLPFTHSGDGEIDFLRGGAVEILSTDIMTPGVAAPVDPRAVRLYLEGRDVDVQSPDAISAAASHFQARYVVIGGLSELRGQLRLNAALLDMSAAGARVMDVETRGPSAKAFDLFEDLSRQLLAALPGAGRGGAARATSSLRALRAYLQGELLYQQGHFAESLDAYQVAMREDSTFASAAYRFHVTGEWTGTVTEDALAEALARAVRHSARLPEPDRMLIEARAALKQLDLDRADQLYLRVLRGQPNNVEAWYQLGDLRFHWGSPLGRSYQLSRDAFEHVLQLDPANGPALIHLARIAAGGGQRAALDTLIRALKRLGPDERFAQEADLLAALRLGDAKARQRAVTTTLGEIPQRWHDGARQSAAFTGDLASAARLAAAYAEQGPAAGPRREEAIALQTLIELGRGRPAAARRLLSPSRPLAAELRAFALTLPWIASTPEELNQLRRDLARIRRDSAAYLPRRVFLEGMLAIRAGDAEGARAAMALLRDTRSLPSPFNEYARFFAKVLAAAALQSEGRPADALAALGPATAVQRTLPTVFGYPFIHARFLRATLLEETGKLDEALQWFATFPEPEGCDVPYRAAAYIARSRIHARMGRKDLARAEITAVRELWRDAEPENARVLANAADYVNRE
jgi:tetratricopeptide (TPR) repeat protein